MAALELSKRSTSKPTFINVRTIIGLDSAVAGEASAHGAAFGADDVAAMKKVAGFNPDEHFVVSESVRVFFEDLPSRGQALVKQWEVLVQRYASDYPDLAV